MTRRILAGRSGALTREDWVQAAYRAIAEGGVAAAAVEPLAQQLGVTKGSFYWHFPNRDALLIATLAQWEQDATEAVIVALDQIPDPGDRLRELVSEAFITDNPCAGFAAAPGTLFRHAFDLALSEAAADPIVQPILQRVSERRVDFLEECYRGLGFSSDAARYRALLAYAAYVGTLRLAREAPSRMPRGKEYAAYQAHLIATLITGDGSGTSVEKNSLFPEAPGQRDEPA